VNGTSQARVSSGGALTLDTGDATIYGVRVGRGGGAVATNTAVGASALSSNTTGSNNTCIGTNAGFNLTTGSNNTIIGNVQGTAGLANTVIIGAGATERLRITSDAYVRLAAGTGGIQFNGDTAAANALDDYEEGTWTPTQGAGFTITGDFIASGAYTKIGNLVSYAGLVYGTISGTFDPAGGNFLGGLPFSPVSFSTGGAVNGNQSTYMIVFNSGANIYGQSVMAQLGGIYFSGFYLV
jgi:hypothetical protein